MKIYVEIAIFILFFIYLYKKFCWKPKIKIVKAPTPDDIKKQHKKERRFRKIKRRFRIPYHGKTQITEFDKTKPYIESAWNEIQKPKK